MPEITPGSWYRSKRGVLVRVDEIRPSGSAMVIVQTTGNRLEVDKEQLAFFTAAEAPVSQPGTSIKTAVGHADSYAKYPHIVPGSIYRVQNNTGTHIPKWSRTKRAVTGATRCIIKCPCGLTRDIKLQDAFQVKLCEVCQKSKKRKRLNQFLADKKDPTNEG